MERNVIEFFKKMIAKHEKQNRMTRTANIVGHLSKREDMRIWFYERYPNPSDWTDFFHDHQNDFIYDETSGNIRVKTNSQIKAEEQKIK